MKGEHEYEFVKHFLKADLAKQFVQYVVLPRKNLIMASML